MNRKKRFRFFPLFLLTAALALSGCAQLIEPVTVQGEAPTPIVSVGSAGVDNPDVFVDTEAFKPVLLKAMVERDTTKLQLWMTEPFLTGGWTADMSDTPPADAVNELMSNYLSEGRPLVLVKDVDLKALLAGTDPLSIPRAEAGVVDAFLVGGWGKDGRDEAVLFISREPSNALKWHGWMVIKGGFSGTRQGGSQLYQNDALGFGVYLPKGYMVSTPLENEVVFTEPLESPGPLNYHPDDNHVGVFVTTSPANGLTAEQHATRAAEEAKAAMGAGYTGAAMTAMGIDGEPAFSVNQLPGQDFNRQLFIVHNKVLYQLTFIPDNPQAEAYQRMEDVYAMIVNTWRFK